VEGETMERNSPAKGGEDGAVKGFVEVEVT
jgi:hypothetical protein